MRFNLHRKLLCAKAGKNMMHYARQGIITLEVEFIALRENQRRDDRLVRLCNAVLCHPEGAPVPAIPGLCHTVPAGGGFADLAFQVILSVLPA